MGLPGRDGEDADQGSRYAEFPSNTWDRVLVHATALAKEAAARASRRDWVRTNDPSCWNDSG
jgi:hypothetical protein